MLENPKEEVDKVLLHWNRNAKRSQAGHYEAYHYYSKFNLYLGVPIVVLSTLVGTNVFANLKNTLSSEWMIITGLLSLLAAILAALQTFLGFSEKASKHADYAAEYGSIRREFQEARIRLVNVEKDFETILQPMRDKLERLAKYSPKPPRKIWKNMEQKMPPISFTDYFTEEKNNK